MLEEIPIECYVTREGNLVKFVRYEKIQELQEEIKRLKEEYMILQNASDEVEEEKDKEIERLTNIINELEKYCKEMAHIEENELIAMNDFEEVYIDVLDKIKELKGSDKE